MIVMFYYNVGLFEILPRMDTYNKVQTLQLYVSYADRPITIRPYTLEMPCEYKSLN